MHMKKNIKNSMEGGSYISPSCEVIALVAEQLICQSGDVDAPDSTFDDLLDIVDIPWIL